jgi:5,10-methylenetetrahydromethanopterin reductase
MFARFGESDTVSAQSLDVDFIERFAVAGPAEEVRERLAAIADVGISRLIVVPGSLDADPAAIEESNARFAEAVLPDLVG